MSAAENSSTRADTNVNAAAGALTHVIDTPRLRLRLVEEGDLADLLAVNGDDEVTKYLPYATWRDLDDARAWLERMRRLHVQEGVLQFVVIEKETGRIIGSCLLFQFNEPSRRAEIGYVLGRAHWGRGCMQEAAQALIAHAFDTLGLRRLVAQVDARNIASHTLLLRLGFVCEGTLREHGLIKGDLPDARVYGLLAREWTGAPAGGSRRA